MQLRELFYRAQGQRMTSWNEIKQEPGQPTLMEFKALVTRLQCLKPLQVASSALAVIPETKWLHCAAEAMALGVTSHSGNTDVQAREPEETGSPLSWGMTTSLSLKGVCRCMV